MSAPLRAVLLDAGNTLLFVDPERVLPVFRDAGADADRETFRRAEYRARLNLAEVVEDGHRGTEAHVWEHYFHSLFAGCGVPEDRMEEVGGRLREIHREGHLWTHVEEGTEAALGLLADAGYRLGVISNADGRVEGLLEGAGLRTYFEFVLDSEVLGVEKPDPEIFLRATELLDLEPEECLYVGDLYPVDVVGARRAGLRALLLDPFGDQEAPVDRIPSVSRLPGYLEGDVRGIRPGPGAAFSQTEESHGQ